MDLRYAIVIVAAIILHQITRTPSTPSAPTPLSKPRRPNMSKLAIVTGSNKGLGFEIVKKLAVNANKYNIATIIATARNRTAGEKAIQDILSANDVECELVWRELDIAKKKSRDKFIKGIENDYPQGVDILINNAAISSATNSFDDTLDYNSARRVIDTNYYGTMIFTMGILPVLNKNGRVVMLSSRLGTLGGRYSKAIKSRFLDSNNYLDEVNTLMEEFVSGVKTNTLGKDWPSSSYSVSKAGLNAAVRAVVNHADEVREKNITIVNTCPGWCRTDMGGKHASKSSEEGADTPVWAATSDKVKNGKFYGERSEVSY